MIALITILILFVVIAFLLVYVIGRKKKVEAILDVIDIKIADFKSKTFSSEEEKERAKSELKTELLRMKDDIRDMGSMQAVLASRERALSKIVEL